MVHQSDKSNSVSYEIYCTKTLFETEAIGNSELASSHYFILFFIGIFFLFLTLLGIECYACSSQPELLGGTKCESGKAEKITCDPSLFNRCMTVKFTGSLGASGSMSLELRNCSNILFCDPDSQFSRK